MKLTKKYIQKAYTFFDILNFLVLRYSRTRPLNGNSLFTRFLHRLYPVLSLRSIDFNGLKLLINPADFTHIKITDEFFFDNIYDFKLIPFKPDCIIDCGAHIGMFTILAQSKFPDVPIHVFEPNPQNIEYIKRQIAINNISKVILKESAVSNYNGRTTFENSGVSFGGYLSNSKITKDSFSVSVINLMEYIQEIKSNKLLIKIDIEGEEEHLIPSLIDYLPKQCVLFFEYHFGLERFENIKLTLESKGFDVKISRVVDNLYIDVVSVLNNVERVS